VIGLLAVGVGAVPGDGLVVEIRRIPAEFGGQFSADCLECGLFQDSESGRPGLHSVEEIGDAVCDVVADQTTMPDGLGNTCGIHPAQGGLSWHDALPGR
jgi:hypothetical protein